MKQAYLSDAVAGAPPSTGATSVGNPSDGDPAGGVEATALGAYAMFQLFKELEAVITEGSLTPDVDDLTQVRQAVQAMIDASGLDETAGDARYLRRTQNLSDVNSAGTARTSIGAAPLASPVFTGNPQAPTQAAGNDSKRIATTAYVQDEIDNINIPGGVILATRNEHLQASPPTGEAAVPAYVQDMIEVLEAALIDSAPANRDTLDQLYDVLNTAIALKANISGPTFTGNPKAPTPSTSDDDTSIATTGFVQNVRDALLTTIEDGAPSSRDTLDELYDVLNAAIVLKANIASPTFTGTARAPTPSAGDDSTRIATTAWLNDFFGDASRRAFTTAGAHSYDWEWSTPNGLAIIVGGGGGPGGGGGGGAPGSSNQGQNVPSGMPGTAGTDGGDTSVEVNGTTYLADGGSGGPGGRGGQGARTAERGGYGYSFNDDQDYGDGRGGDGGAGGPGTGNLNGGRGQDGGGDRPGQMRTVEISGLSNGDTMAVTIGAGGGPGSGAAGGSSFFGAGGDGDDAVGNGDDGSVILIPLF